ncbi:hypothetical protein FQN60_012602 [Etheostoma spectabile]|uniref:Uncharacterized protein n=1 Tax=Etheostoma spectabile TaxID=54343 RepID=A0A5J5D597_9PERO|nr:hypothetical protein FQN60_012602 [Etheostoma spectabile]
MEETTNFVWKGQKANEGAQSSNDFCKQVIKDKNYPQNTKIQVIPEGSETTLFKQFFFNWLDKDETTGQVRHTPSVTLPRWFRFPLTPPNSTTTSHGCPAWHGGRWLRKVQIWRVEGGAKVPVDPSTYGQFFGGDCYRCCTLQSGGREKHIIYTGKGGSALRMTWCFSLSPSTWTIHGWSSSQVRCHSGPRTPSSCGVV